jgi:hypothetical protein
MGKFRNGSNDTIVCAHSMKVAKPDEVISVPDEWDDAYADHPVWQRVPDAVASLNRGKGASKPESTEEVSE